MTKKLQKLICVILGVVMICPFAACAGGENPNFKISEPYNGKELDLTPQKYETYLSLTDENAIAKYLATYTPERVVVTAKPVELSWESKIDGANKFTVIISDKADFSDIVHTEKTSLKSISVSYLIPNTYYWKVKDNLGNETKADTFKVANYVRAMDVAGIDNFRDIGGWKTEDGKTVKYGLSYRCAVLKKGCGLELSNMLNLKTEIDLRANDDKGDYSTSVVPKEYRVNFLQAPIMQSDYVLKNKDFYSSLTPEQIKAKRHESATFKQEYADSLYAIFKLYTDESNYPILFHCTSGADRTGTVAFLLEGMLGVEIDDLYRDFELTTLVMGGKRWRSNVAVSGDEYSFTDDGFVTVEGNYVAMGLLYRGLMEGYSTGDGKLSSAIKNYLKTDVGLTDADFEAIRNIMLK